MSPVAGRTPKPPSLASYGLSKGDIPRLKQRRKAIYLCSRIGGALAGVSIAVAWDVLAYGHLRFAFLAAPFWALLGMGVGGACEEGIAPRLDRRIRRYAQFEAAQRAFESAKKQREEEELRAHTEYWRSLSGHRFEHELATLFERAGYSVQPTPGSGDAGIDIILRHSGKTTIVQCKQTKNPVSPAVARELYGALIASQADDGILAATGGVTSGVHKFFFGKPLRVVGLREIISLHRAAMEKKTTEDL